MKKIYGAILGHHPLLSTAEVFASLGNSLQTVAWDQEFFIFSTEKNLPPFWTFGGIQKWVESDGKIYTSEELLEASWNYVARIHNHREGKFHFAVSVYGKMKKHQEEVLMSIKKTAQQQQMSFRFIHKDVRKNVHTPYLISERIVEKGIDLCICSVPGGFVLGHTVALQDIHGYTKRDMEKPHRDMKNGILPPKLAQTMLQFAGACSRIWDPFCGSGVLVMEGLLMGKEMLATDYNTEMLTQTKENVQWLQDHYVEHELPAMVLEEADARRMASWTFPKNCIPEAIVTEGYLGKNFLMLPFERDARMELAAIEDLWIAFLRGIRNKVAPGFILVGAFPFYPGLHMGTRSFWKKAHEIGFELVPFFPDQWVQQHIPHMLRKSYAAYGTIQYTREQQWVGRELFRFKKS